MTRTTSRELAHRISSIQKGLELDKINDRDLLALLIETRKMDDTAMEIILKKEGEMIAQENFIYSIENQFLQSQTLQTIREYKETSSDDWGFLNKDEQDIIYNTIKILKKTTLEYTLERADLMIMRKEAIDFIQTRLKTLNSTLNANEIIDIIINNYTYLDTLKNLGYNKNSDDILSKYYLDENLVYRLV